MKSFEGEVRFIVATVGFLVIIILLLIITIIGNDEKTDEYDASQVIIVDVKGDFWSMGFQYGEKLRIELKETYEVLVEYYWNVHQVNIDQMLDFGNVYAGLFPRNIHLFFEGVGEGSGLGTEKVKLLNSQLSLLNLIQPDNEEVDPGHCTYFTVPPTKSRSGNLLIGRNFDFPAPHEVISKNLVLLNIHPTDPSYHTYSLITFPGEIFCSTCFNDEGLMISVNNGGDSGSWVARFDRETLVHKLSVVAETSVNFPHVRRIMNSIQADTSLIVNIASQDDRSSFEFSSLHGMKEFHEKISEFFVSTNHYQNKTWNIVTNTESKEWRVPDSRTRRKNMMILLEELHGGTGFISVDNLKDIMEVKYEDGGALRKNTLFQVIFDVGQDHFHIKTVNGGIWESVHLTKRNKR